MTLIDIAVIASIALVALAPSLPNLWLALKSRLSPLAPAGQAADTPQEASQSQESWRQGWTGILIDLLGDLEEKQMVPATKLCRELMWEVIGGADPDKVATGKGK